MQNVPLANRRHVAIFGDTNAGKSALFNAIIGQSMMIVSEQKGTTTDPVIKAMELIPYGPVALVDTAGLGDDSTLGDKRMSKTREIIDRADYAIYAADAMDFDTKAYDTFLSELAKRETPSLLVFTKSDELTQEKKNELLGQFPDSIFTSIKDEESILVLKARLSDELTALGEDEKSMIADLVPPDGTAILVCPIDSAAPKGRLILPQVQLMRDCLDHGIKCYVIREKELASALKDLKHVDLVVTDSQAFELVSSLVPDEIPLTSFSLLMARQKGKIKDYLDGVEAIENLKDGSKVLISEGCSHNVTHEDIGRIKIPKWLRAHTGKALEFDFVNGYQFPADISEYDLVIQCGGCMLNRKAVLSRIAKCKEEDIKITNYGVIIACMTGILDRCKTVFSGKID